MSQIVPSSKVVSTGSDLVQGNLSIILISEIVVLLIVAVVVIAVRQRLLKQKTEFEKEQIEKEEKQREKEKEQLKQDFKEDIDSLKNEIEHHTKRLEKDISFSGAKLEERLIETKKSVRQEFSNVTTQCQAKYDILTRHEERHEALVEKVNQHEKKLDTHKTEMNLRLTNINEKVTGLEKYIKEDLSKQLKEGFESLSEIKTNIALLKKDQSRREE